MMQMYYVKSELPGIPAGRVERFRLDRAAALNAIVKSDALDAKAPQPDPPLEPFDPQNKKHANAKERQERDAEENRLRAEALLKEERENPTAARAREEARRRVAEAEEAKRMAERRKEEIEREGRRNAA